MQDDNLPKDRMILVESMDPEDNVLLNVDEISAVRRYNERPMIYIGPEPQPYGRGLTIVLQSGAVYKVETEMTLREFEIERAKKFTPVVETEKDKLAGADWGESDWNVDEVRTEWYYYHAGASQWVGVSDMGVAIDESKRQGTKRRAEMYRKLSKEWGDQNDD